MCVCVCVCVCAVALSDMVWMSASFALVIGSELHDHQTTGVPRDHALISALLDSAVILTHSLTHQPTHTHTLTHPPTHLTLTHSPTHSHTLTHLLTDHSSTHSLTQWKMTDTERRELSLQEFHQWTASHCPRLLDGLIQWITSSLLLINLEGEGQGAESRAAQQPV